MQEKDIYSDLSAIRSLMERSTKFISLSGLSGIMAGIYALLGAAASYKILAIEGYRLTFTNHNHMDTQVAVQLLIIALAVLILSLVTGIFLTIRQANKKGENYWNPVSKRLMFSMTVPLLTGGLFILSLILHGDDDKVAAACLLFYGLALISGSQYTLSDVKWLGAFEILLGLLAAFFPALGFIFWVLGFGVLHILYGTIMHFKYNQ